MAHASSIHGVALRATRLGEDGKPLVGEKNSYVTSAYMKFGFTPEYTAGDEIEEKSANGNVCVYYQGEDVMKRVTFSLSLCNPDPDLTQMLAGGTLLLPQTGTEAIGYASPIAGAEGTPNGVALEVWSHAIIAGRKAGTDKFWRWVFPFAKMKFTGSQVIYVLLLACMAVPIASVTMPLFFTIKTFGLTNTYLGMIIPLVAFNALQMLLLWRNYFNGVPDEIIEAARVDGCGSLRIWARILMPISTPMIATTGVLTFVYSWNEYLIPLLLIRDESKYPVTLASTYFMETRSQTPEMVAQEYAALILMTIPSIIVYLISQKWLQSGITAGAVKS